MQVVTGEDEMEKAPGEAVAEVRERSARTPEEVRAGVDPADPNGDGTDVISTSAMRGDVIVVELYGQTFRMKPLKRRQLREELSPRLAQWPLLLQTAAMTDTTGIDLEAIARFRAALRDERGAALYAGVTVPELAAEMRQVYANWEYFEPAILETIYLFTDGAGMDRAAVDAALDELEIPDFADLLREMLNVLGRFRGCYRKRFTTP